MVLQLVPRTEQLYKEISARGFNPGIQIKFKETKPASYVVQYLMSRWSTILSLLSVKEVRIYPRKINFGCATHNGWGMESSQHAMSKVKREVQAFHLHGSAHLDQQPFEQPQQQSSTDEPFIMEYDFICGQPANQQQLPLGQLHNSQSQDLKKGSTSTTLSVVSSHSSFQKPPPVSQNSVIAIPSVVPQKSCSSTTTSTGFITSFADVSHVLDSMRNAQVVQPSSIGTVRTLSVNSTLQHFPSVLPSNSNTQAPIVSPTKSTSSRKRKTKEESTNATSSAPTTTSPKKKRTSKKKKDTSTVVPQNTTPLPPPVSSQNKLLITPSQVEASLSNFLNTADLNSQFSQFNNKLNNNLEGSNLSELFNLHFGFSCKEQTTTNFGSLFGGSSEVFNMNPHGRPSSSGFSAHPNAFKTNGSNLVSTTSFVNTMTPSKTSNILHIISNNDSSLIASLREKSTGTIGPIDDSLQSLFA
nr:unnamed protein product [Naegleria fowleri]